MKNRTYSRYLSLIALYFSLSNTTLASESNIDNEYRLWASYGYSRGSSEFREPYVGYSEIAPTTGLDIEWVRNNKYALWISGDFLLGKGVSDTDSLEKRQISTSSGKRVRVGTEHIHSFERSEIFYGLVFGAKNETVYWSASYHNICFFSCSADDWKMTGKDKILTLMAGPTMGIRYRYFRIQLLPALHRYVRFERTVTENTKNLPIQTDFGRYAWSVEVRFSFGLTLRSGHIALVD